MYFSARHIDIKLSQDRTDFINSEDYKSLVICDGIGEFNDSGKVADVVTNLMIDKSYSSIEQVVLDNELKKLKDDGIKGGTTVIFCKEEKKGVYIEYLGNGGIIHLNGDYAVKTTENIPFQYCSLMLPHVSLDGSLTRHISHHSTKNELLVTKLNLNLNSINGDIILLYSDGINSLENNIILKDGNDRYWRNESSSIQFILEKLHSFLRNLNNWDEFHELLVAFNQDVLIDLKNNNFLEDDASLGIIITDAVLDYYKNSKWND